MIISEQINQSLDYETTHIELNNCQHSICPTLPARYAYYLPQFPDNTPTCECVVNPTKAYYGLLLFHLFPYFKANTYASRAGNKFLIHKFN